ncbi:hypothetical protein D9M68_802400 [compost metagenome]
MPALQQILRAVLHRERHQRTRVGQAFQSELRKALLAGRHHAQARFPEKGRDIACIAVDVDAPRQAHSVDARLERRLQGTDAVCVQLRVRNLFQDAFERLEKQLMLLFGCVARQIDHPLFRRRSRFDGLGHTGQRVRNHFQFFRRHTGLEQVPMLLFGGNDEAVARV